MRGTTSRQVTMLGAIDPERLIPANHPIRRVKPLAEAALRELRRGRVLLEKGLAALQLPFFPTAANFVLVNIGERMKEIVAKLSRRGILIRDRSSDFDGAGYTRITFGTPAQIRRLLAELKQVL